MTHSLEGCHGAPVQESSSVPPRSAMKRRARDASLDLVHSWVAFLGPTPMRLHKQCKSQPRGSHWKNRIRSNIDGRSKGTPASWTSRDTPAQSAHEQNSRERPVTKGLSGMQIRRSAPTCRSSSSSTQSSHHLADAAEVGIFVRRISQADRPRRLIARGGQDQRVIVRPGRRFYHIQDTRPQRPVRTRPPPPLRRGQHPAPLILRRARLKGSAVDFR